MGVGGGRARCRWGGGRTMRRNWRGERPVNGDKEGRGEGRVGAPVVCCPRKCDEGDETADQVGREGSGGGRQARRCRASWCACDRCRRDLLLSGLTAAAVGAMVRPWEGLTGGRGDWWRGGRCCALKDDDTGRGGGTTLSFCASVRGRRPTAGDYAPGRKKRRQRRQHRRGRRWRRCGREGGQEQVWGGGLNFILIENKRVF